MRILKKYVDVSGISKTLKTIKKIRFLMHCTCFLTPCLVDLSLNPGLNFCFPEELVVTPKATSFLLPDLLLDPGVSFCFPEELF
jgi:hypothetical protein